MNLTDPRLTADRVRAALAFSNINVTDSLQRVGISKATMQRIVSPTNPRGASIEEMQLVAVACPDVPAWFLEHGFSPPVETGETDLRQELNDTRDELEALLARVARIDQVLQDARDQGLLPGSREGEQL